MLRLVLVALFLRAASILAGSLSSQQTIVSNSINRTFFYYAPDNYTPAQGLLMYLHGGGGNGSSSAGQGTDFLWQNLADRVGVFTLFPEGKPYSDDPTSKTWNTCQDDVRPTANCVSCTDWDDVQFIRDLITWTVTKYNSSTNTNRVYVAGESEGSQMSERLALEANDVIAAAGIVAGNLPVSNDNGPTYKCQGYTEPYTPGTNEAVQMFFFKGNADPLIQYGSTTGPDHQYYALYSDWCHRPAYGETCPPQGGTCLNGCDHSYYDTIAFWQWKLNLSTNNKTQVAPTSTVSYADTIPDCTNSCTKCDGSHVIRTNFGSTPYQMVVDTAVGGGHHFPGPSADTPGCAIESQEGWKNRDTLGSNDGFPYIAEEFWAFASQFTLAD